MVIKSILVPVDFSEPTQRALDYALELARPFKAELIALHVLEPIAYASPADLYAGVAAQLGDLITEQRRSAREQMAKLQATFAKRRTELKTVIREGTAHQEIVAVAAKLKVDLILLTTHGRTGLSHLLMGSVAERVVRTAPCPVLSLRGPLLTQTQRPRTKKKATAKRPAAKKPVRQRTV
ncbi:MAG TPA: universal stress protein [Terriglobales bacterium]|nr:universal stress protein [Terriglobales bacterium]